MTFGSDGVFWNSLRLSESSIGHRRAAGGGGTRREPPAPLLPRLTDDEPFMPAFTRAPVG